MKFGLWNDTLEKWVLDDEQDYKPYETASLQTAGEALDRVNELKRLNPKHKDDLILIRLRP